MLIQSPNITGQGTNRYIQTMLAVVVPLDDGVSLLACQPVTALEVCRCRSGIFALDGDERCGGSSSATRIVQSVPTPFVH